MNLAGFLASILIGVLLGLIGGGGSILTVPVLVYLFKLEPVLATTYSLFIVGITSIAGSVSYFARKLINVRTALLFGIPSIAAVFLARIYIIPAIPETILSFDNFELTRDIFILFLFAILMIFVAFGMIKKTNPIKASPTERSHHPITHLFLQGSGVGMITGLIGAGGGFLIVPSLVTFLRLPLRIAIGTSLFIIALNSLAGFTFSAYHKAIQWQPLLLISFIAIIGIFLGSFLSTRIDAKKLRPAFGWFVLVTGIYIIVKETLLK